VSELELRLHVPASESFAQRQPHTLKSGDTFVVFDRSGDLRGELGGDEHATSPEGLYREDTRIVSRFAWRLDGEPALLLSATARNDPTVFSADLTNADLYDGDRLALARELIYLNRRKFVWQGAMYERILLRNFDQIPHRVTLDAFFDADFADVFEVRGERRPRRGTLVRSLPSPSCARIHYTALDDVTTDVDMNFDPEPAHIDTMRARYVLNLAPGEHRRLFARAGISEGERAWTAPQFFAALRAARREFAAIARAATTVSSSNATFDEIVRRSASDLSILVTRTALGSYAYAGIPWFATAFGRDGIITALFTLWLDPSIARGVLRFLAATQAVETDPSRDAEPGKILHEMRHGEMARLGEVPFARYYGSVDATPLFVMLLEAYYARTGDLELVRELWPNCSAALDWIDRYGDLDGDGFVEYARKTPGGLDNQGWKDSHDAIFHADGSLASAPIALCEVQGYVYAAKRGAAALAAVLGYPAQAAQLAEAARELREHFDAAFWCEELNTYAMALDATKAQCRVVSSNAGHALFSGIATAERASSVAKVLMGQQCFSGWGIRTVATSASRYNPMSYHNGSVWPHDNAIIALGLGRYGFKAEVGRLFRATVDAAACMELRRLPELFCGFERRRESTPTLYPVACSPQAWASAAPFAMLAANLGLVFDVARNEIRFERPVLPAFLSELHLRGLTLAGSSIDVEVRRHGTELALNVKDRHGSVRVSVEY
jgi:glycogen debranching enzyme